LQQNRSHAPKYEAPQRISGSGQTALA
jgi:hypothetical protein